MAFTLQIGDKAKDFSLPGVDGQTYALASFRDAKVLVVVFACNHCPYVINSLERMKEFYQAFAVRGVAMIAINSNSTENHSDDSFEHMQRHAKDERLPWIYARDEAQDVARAYGALRTPHFYVFDQQRVLRYTGRLDDNPRHPGMQTTQELRDAVNAVLAGEKPAVEVTNPIGCNIKWNGKPEKWMPAEACDLV